MPLLAAAELTLEGCREGAARSFLPGKVSSDGAHGGPFLTKS